MSHLSLKDIGDALGVSAMSVSLAIRGKPGVSAPLRKRVLEYVRQRGYEPDPVAAELMSRVRSRRKRKETEVIAFLNTFVDPLLMEKIPALGDFFEGAKTRAASFGYRVDAFQARSAGMTGPRLSRILESRGIRGVLVGPRWRTEPDIDFDWDKFSVVLVGEAEYGPNIYRVCNHHVHTCAMTLRQLAERGYRRIGVQLVRSDEVLRGHDYSLGVDQYRRDPDAKAEVRVELIERFDEQTFYRWIESSRLDAVVTLHNRAWAALKSWRGLDGRQIGYANLNVPKGSNWTGVDQHLDQIGAAAVDLLRALLHGGERGEAPAPRILLIDGSWVDGDTAPVR